MFPQYSVATATVILGSVFSMATFAAEMECDDKKKRRAASASAQSLESIVDIHNSPVILAHPTKFNSSEESIAELQKLRVAGELRDSKMRAAAQAQGKPYPERFAGD